MAQVRTVNDLLKDAFESRHVDSAIRHFNAMVVEFQRSEWDDASAKGGRFIEAVLKALWTHVGQTVPPGKQFSAGFIIDQIANKASGFPDTIRLTIPRACRFIYDIASNRGARHDPDEINSNEMDASSVLNVCGWILSEMIRFSQKGRDLDQPKAVVEGLMRRRFPFTEEIDGRIYSDVGNSAREVAVLILWHIYPRRLHEDELIRSLVRHEYTENNATVSVSRLKRFIDDDGQGNLKLRNTGLRWAETLISEASGNS